ncbi:uncharacterized protein LOC108625403 isoform X2 [Ceratina calcarata]|uniref:Small RNA 2'-O-methyltransferase n=1 Tax=Ceratina calcarata TaxID=156304 RepID=A0AAJ7J084_9HYME|nr:uncharacterized protein LOC108625403 isoform X2 [Ceratina calcarata]
MILVLFHVLYFFGKFVYQSYRTKRRAIKDETIGTEKRFNVSDADFMLRDCEVRQDFEQKSIKFFPPAYVQRYVAVIDVLRNSMYQGKLRKVVDFGCAELDFLVYMKNTQGIEEILCVDIDRTLLESFENKAAPLVCEYLNTRTAPLVIEVCEGSVTLNDKKLENTDAVICIELIEHLYPNELTDLPHNIFGYIQPKLVVITTPNADFNVLFPNFSGFRHPDHKFEWTRQQFQDWAENVTSRYPDYEVKFDGICKGPEGTEHLGCCSQMAIFERVTDKEIYSRGIEGLFKTVARYEYPFRVDNRSDEEKILDEATFYIRQLSTYNIEDEAMEAISLEQLVDMLKRSFHVSMESLKTILEEANWTIEDRGLGPVVVVPERTYSDYDLMDDDVQWNDNYSGSDGNSWTQEPGPPINSRYAHPDSSTWYSENWDQEPSIIIPQNDPAREDNTDLFDNENVLLLDSASEVMIDTETVAETAEISRENLNPLPSVDSFSNTLADSSYGREFEEDTRQDSLLETTTGTRDGVAFNSVRKLNRTLDVPLYMSVSRASTSPEPYLLQTVRVDQRLQDNSMCDQSMSNQWMLNNSLEQKVIMEASEDERQTSKGSNSNDEDHSLHRICLNTSYNEMEDSDVERVNVNTSENAICLGREQTLSIQRDSETSKNEHIKLNTVPSTNTLIESSPQFTSSPKIQAKPNTMSKKRRSLDYKGSKSDNSSSNATGLTTSSNDSLGISREISPRNSKSVHISTATTSSFSDRDGYTYLDETGLTNNSNDTLTSSDTSTIGSTFNVNKGTTEELSDSDSLSNERNKSVNNPDTSIADTSVEDRAILHLSNGAESSNCDTETPLTNRESRVDFTFDIKTESESESLDDRYSRMKRVNSTGTCRHQAKDVSVENRPLESNESARDAQSVLKSEKCKIRDPNAISIEIIESIELKPSSPETETPSTSWSPEVMDSGYPNTASAQDMTPEFDLSSIAQDHISDSEPPSIAEAPRLEALEVVQVENGDLANNNRDGEGNNMMAAELNDLEDLQPLIDVLENDIENENDIYVLENGFPIWLLRILNMANPLDVEMRMQERRELRLENRAPDDDARNVNAEHDEGFNSSAEEDSDLENNEMRGNANVADENVLMDNAEDVSNSDSGSEQWAGDT